MPPSSKPDRNQTVNRLLRQHDLKHYRTTDRYARDVQRLYDESVKDFTALAGSIFAPEPNAPFSFADYPRAQKEAARLAVELTKNVQHVIEAGQRSQWIAATYRANDYLGTIINRSKLTPDELKQYEDRNLEGLAAFQGRKVQGLNLSERVWKITDQFKEQMELAIDTTLGQGKSAAELSRDVRNLLNEPNKLFRRVRDKYGNLNLSKAAAAYHPGRGVYRSSAQNAMRLARTEINMAYRTADWERWQNEEHVVGIRIQLSNNHTIKNRKGEDEPLIDICDELQGDYPKSFKFVGWHPNCRCTILPILQSPEEMHSARRARLREIMNGETYKAQPSADLVTDIPESFKRHIEAIAERSKGWASQPYYIRDNFKGGTIAGGLSKAIPHKTGLGGSPAKPYTPPQPCTEFDAQIDDLKNQAYSLGLDVSRLDSLRAAGQREPLKAEIDRLQALSDDRSAQWIAASGNLRNFIRCCKGAGQAFIDKYLDVVKVNGYSLKSYYQAAIDALNHAKDEAEKEWQKIKDEEAKAKAAVQIKNAKKELTAFKTKAAAFLKGASLPQSQQRTLEDAIYGAELALAAGDLTLYQDRMAEAKHWLFTYQNPSKLNSIVTAAVAHKIDYIDVKPHTKQPTIQEIIDRVGGGDNTTGSCASLAYAYAANVGGYDVLDFRDGISRSFFSKRKYGGEMCNQHGGIWDNTSSGIELMRTTEIGKEYIIRIGRHAAVVRQIAKGKYEYLELQSATSNGWKHLDSKKFASRFDAKGRCGGCIVEISKLYNDPSFIKLMGYINTAPDKQNKSATGTIK